MIRAKLLNFLFGWDFVAISFAYEHKIKKVFYLDSRAFIWLSGELVELSKTHREVIWLTKKRG